MSKVKSCKIVMVFEFKGEAIITIIRRSLNGGAYEIISENKYFRKAPRSRGVVTWAIRSFCPAITNLVQEEDFTGICLSFDNYVSLRAY